MVFLSADYVAYMSEVAAAAPNTPFILYDIDFVTGIPCKQSSRFGCSSYLEVHFSQSVHFNVEVLLLYFDTVTFYCVTV